MKYTILEPYIPGYSGMVEFEDGYRTCIFTKRDEDFVKKKAGKDFIGFG